MTSQRDEATRQPAGEGMTDAPIVIERRDEILTGDDPADEGPGAAAGNGTGYDRPGYGRAGQGRPGYEGPGDEGPSGAKTVVQKTVVQVPVVRVPVRTAWART